LGVLLFLSDFFIGAALPPPNHVDVPMADATGGCRLHYGVA